MRTSLILIFFSPIFVVISGQKLKLFSSKQIFKKKLLSNIPIFKFILINYFIVIATKQGIKIFNNYKNTPWPNIYTLDSKGKIY